MVTHGAAATRLHLDGDAYHHRDRRRGDCSASTFASFQVKSYGDQQDVAQMHTSARFVFEALVEDLRNVGFGTSFWAGLDEVAAFGGNAVVLDGGGQPPRSACAPRRGCAHRTISTVVQMGSGSSPAPTPSRCSASLAPPRTCPPAGPTSSASRLQAAAPHTPSKRSSVCSPVDRRPWPTRPLPTSSWSAIW